jgi:uncharacterized protein (DUF433 family)
MPPATQSTNGKGRSPIKTGPPQRPIEVGKHLIIHPGVCFGKMTFKGTRVPVETILCYLSTGKTIEDVHEGWPYLKREAVQEAILLAAKALADQYHPIPKAGNRSA